MKTFIERIMDFKRITYNHQDYFATILANSKKTPQILSKLNHCAPTSLAVGDSDVGDFMMVADYRCWRQNYCVDDFFIMFVIFLMY